MKWLKKIFKRKPKFHPGGIVTGPDNRAEYNFHFNGPVLSRQEAKDLVSKALEDAKRRGRLLLCTSLKTTAIQTWYLFGSRMDQL